MERSKSWVWLNMVGVLCGGCVAQTGEEQELDEELAGEEQFALRAGPATDLAAPASIADSTAVTKPLAGGAAESFATTSGINPGKLPGQDVPPPPDTVSDGPATFSDLTLDGTMRIIYPQLQIDVTNRGNVAASGAFSYLTIDGTWFTGSLQQYWGGTAKTPNTLNAAERGYILVDLSSRGPDFLRSCQTRVVQIDTSHVLQQQSGTLGPSVYANDGASVRTNCLTWNSPITTATLGHAPDRQINGKTLQGIVSSVMYGREDGYLCNSCHYKNSSWPVKYKPNVPMAAAVDPNTGFVPINYSVPRIDPNGVYSFFTWAPPYGGSDVDDLNWARAFANALPNGRPKPAYLVEAFQKWLADGAYLCSADLRDAAPCR
jgi:hypothetical protein